jgi:hypothetical protein
MSFANALPQFSRRLDSNSGDGRAQANGQLHVDGPQGIVQPLGEVT